MIHTHLDLFLLLLAERGVDADTQRRRADELVRCLDAVRFEPSLFVEGRRLPLKLDRSSPSSPPVLILNEEFLGRVDDHEIMTSLARPVCEILKLAPIEVGLALQGRDERALRNLYHSVRARAGHEAARAVSVSAVIEHRVEAFAHRLRALVASLSGGMNMPLAPPHRFVSWLGDRRLTTWPEWEQVCERDFVVKLRSSAEMVLGARSSALTPEILTALCWQSLELSAPSFLRQAARDLRTRELPIDEALLRTLAQVVAEEELSEIEKIESWPALKDLQDAWVSLYANEISELAAYHTGSTRPPLISAFAAPKDSLLLREPESLPWDYPLLCWTVRETNALRDLLNGLIQQRRPEHSPGGDPGAGALPVAKDHAPRELALKVHPNARHVQTRVLPTTLELPAGYEAMSQRAQRAALARITEQLEALDEASRLNLCNRIRGCYDGFFMNTSKVWQRRLQGWKLDPLPVAVERLCATISELFDLPVLFDPFLAPDQNQPRPVPAFCFVIALSEQLERVPFYVPLSALAMTDGMGTPPLQLRMIEVPEDPHAPCLWLGDEDLSMETMQGQPVSTTLSAIEHNRLRLLAYA